MYGLIGKMTARTGKRDALASMLLDATESMPGCLSYVIATDPADPDALWITEVWDSAASHKASLGLPAVQAAHHQSAAAHRQRQQSSRDGANRRLWLREDRALSDRFQPKLLHGTRDTSRSAPTASGAGLSGSGYTRTEDGHRQT